MYADLGDDKQIDAQVARRLRAESRRQRPAFSQALHERLCAMLEAREPAFRRPRRRRWRMMASVAAVITLFAVWKIAAPVLDISRSADRFANDRVLERPAIMPAVPFDIISSSLAGELLAEELQSGLHWIAGEDMVRLVAEDVRLVADDLLNRVPIYLPELPENATKENGSSDPAVL